MKNIARAIVCLVLVLAGMTGIYLHIDYSGWVLGVGLLFALCADI